MNRLSWKCLAVLALALVVTGCGDGGPRLYKAGGTVTYKNAPVPDAQVMFTYEDGEFASGTTGADGKFQLLYKGRPGGAALGKCKVAVTKTEGVKPNVAPAATTTGTPKTPEEYKVREKAKQDAMINYSKASEEEFKKGGPKSLIPAKYANAATSSLNYEIKSDESQNNFAIELKD